MGPGARPSRRPESHMHTYATFQDTFLSPSPSTLIFVSSFELLIPQNPPPQRVQRHAVGRTLSSAGEGVPRHAVGMQVRAPCPPPAKGCSGMQVGCDVSTAAAGSAVTCSRHAGGARRVHHRLGKFWGRVCGLKASKRQQQVHTPGPKKAPGFAQITTENETKRS